MLADMRDRGASDEKLRDDMRTWAQAVRKLVKAMQAMQVKFDMEDSRRSI